MDEKDITQDSEDSVDPTVAARARALRKEIDELRLEISQMENKIKLSKFGYVRRPEQRPRIIIDEEEILDTLPNVETEIHQDLYKFSGMYCVRSQDSCIFRLSAGGKSTKNKQYSVEILNESGKGKLGRWVLPMSIDVDELLLEYPIANLKNVKTFLRACKHHIECYACRENQYDELKSYMENILNFCLETNLGYTRITIEFIGIKERDTDQTYDIILYLFYNSNEGRPFKSIPDLLSEDRLSDDMLTKFKQYFMPFSLVDLKTALQETLATKEQFIWEAKPKLDDVINIMESSQVMTDDDKINLSENLGEDGNETVNNDNSLRDVDNEFETTQKNDLASSTKNSLCKEEEIDEGLTGQETKKTRLKSEGKKKVTAKRRKLRK